MKTQLGLEEKEMIKFYESNSWVSIKSQELLDKYKRVARNTLADIKKKK
jgi:hypothetical protein